MELTIALNRYDRHVPFFNGTIKPPEGVTLKPLEIGESLPYRDGSDRHARLINDLEFDIGEMGLSSYVMAIARDPEHPIVGIPVFPRRFFSPGQIYVNPKAGIKNARDLIGRNVGVHSFQTTLSVLAKGDLKIDHNVDWESINWYCMREEIIPINLGSDVSVQTIQPEKDIGIMLMEGEIDALISPQPRKSMLENPKSYHRLYTNPVQEDIQYFKKHGYFPIMHLMTMKRALADSRPDLPLAIFNMYNEAVALAYSFYEDSNYALLAWSRNAFEEQKQFLGSDPWTKGFTDNKKNLDQFIKYSYNQRLIEEIFPSERLFHESLVNT